VPVGLEAGAIRAADEADAGEIRRLVRAAYRPYVARIGREPAPMGADFARLAASGRTWVAVAGRSIVGVLVVEMAPDHLFVENLAVRPDRHGRGVGSQLLGFADDLARRARLDEIRLYTNEAMTDNIGYYANRGYRETGRAVVDGYRRVFFARLVPS
jgi:ribosomal protein S18 acetylase RimI-like enzyme